MAQGSRVGVAVRALGAGKESRDPFDRSEVVEFRGPPRRSSCHTSARDAPRCLQLLGSRAGRLLRTDSTSLTFFRQRIADFLSPRTDSASLRLVAEANAVRDTWVKRDHLTAHVLVRTVLAATGPGSAQGHRIKIGGLGRMAEFGIRREAEPLRHMFASLHDVCGLFSRRQ